MRQPDPLILGAGPAGCAAAIVLARAGAAPLIVDRDEQPGDPLCGGFLSWRTMAQLRGLGIDCAKLGAHPVHLLRIHARGRVAQVALPAPACGLSRHALDTALREAALAAGARIECDTIANLSPGEAHGRRQQWRSDSIFLATGKEDVRGHPRPRDAADPALGLRLRLPPSGERTALLAGAIELHLFRGGYAGIVLQEGGRANVCLAVKKSALTRAGNSPTALLDALASANPAFAARLGSDWRKARIGAIGAVPYGWIAQTTEPGLFRLGDQAAVIPSLAGEGIGIALASGQMAANAWLERGAQAAPEYQRDLARRAQPAIRLARVARVLAENPLGARLALLAAAIGPRLVTTIAEHTRIDPAPTLAHMRGAA